MDSSAARRFLPLILLGGIGLDPLLDAQALGSASAHRRLEPSGLGYLYGQSTAAIGDVDGNGTTELAVGSPYGVLPTDSTLWVLFLNSSGFRIGQHEIVGSDAGASDRGEFGASVTGLGDLDDDGIPDIAVGDPSATYAQQGKVSVLFLGSGGAPASYLRIGQALGGFSGSLTPGDRFGAALANLGDLDSDGVVDLAVGAPSDGPDDRGAVWILFLEADGSVRQQQKIDTVEGGFTGALATSDGFGTSLANLGDVDGDGVVDLAVGAPGDDQRRTDAGAIWVLLMEADGTVKSHVKLLPPQDLYSLSSKRFGTSVASLGDLDGNGVVELAAGVPLAENVPSVDDSGVVWILFIRPDGSVRVAKKIASLQGGLPVLLPQGAHFGSSVAAVGDLNDDGTSEFVAGANAYDSRGTVWLLFLNGISTMDFETGDDLLTELENGQDVTSPPELGHSLELSVEGTHLGAAIFDSTPGGPNDPSQDLDLLVDKGNVLILQNSSAPTQSVPGYFDHPNDHQNGGRMTFDLARPARLLSLDLIDIDEGTPGGASVTLTDSSGRSRVYTIPAGWTENLTTQGPPGWRKLDLETLSGQPGALGSATATQTPGFDARSVIRLEILLAGSGAVDRLRWDPRQR